MSTDNTLERFQYRSAALCFNRISPQVYYCYPLASEELQLHSLHMSPDEVIELFQFT
jgi:hypothetical protein